MTTASLIVVVDRGRLKAYRVRETPTRGPKLELVQAFGIPNLNAFSRAHRTTATTDWPELEIEETRQICRQLADEIINLVRRDFGEGWSLAAPESICNQIVDLLPLEIRKRIVERVERDLVKTPVAELLSHFRSLQPV
ncbi:MAG TPA: host attachment protein [Chthoniobacterales bacterium]|nr:host attachment protein [Chthoniobacterales bacterium]